MKTFYTVITSLLLLINLFAQEPIFEWANHLGGQEVDTGNSITIDGEGNTIVTGRFFGEVDFDPGIETMSLYANGGHIFIRKLDPSGNLIWVKQIGGEASSEGTSITSDAIGNIYVAGSFNGTVDFDPGDETTFLTSSSFSNLFIIKLDSDGNLIWAKSFGGFDISIKLDSSGNIYTCGYFNNSIDVDPGAETLIFTSNGSQDAFLQKLDNDGNLIWAQQYGGIGDDKAQSIAIDPSGNDIYITGNFMETVDFNPGTESNFLISNEHKDIFIQKLNSDGGLIWVKSIGGSGADVGNSIAIDNDGYVYTAGYFQETVDFDPGSDELILSSNGYNDIFIQKLDVNGNFVWAKSFGGIWYEEAYSVTTDSDGNVYSTGYFSNTVDFDPSLESMTLSSIGATNIYINKLDGNGNNIWAKAFGGPDLSAGSEIITNSNQEVYTIGGFENSAIFDLGVGTTNFISNGAHDVFIIKLSQSPVGISVNTFEENIQVYPNPSLGEFAVSFENIQEELTLRIMSITGQFIEEQTFLNTNQIQMKLDQPNGLYFLEMTNDEGNKVVIQLVNE